MKDLYAPWRSPYSKSLTKSKQETAQKNECVFCTQCKDTHDEKNFILKRYKHWAVFLNKYPYNAGHLLIVSLEHKKSLNQLPKAARAELMEITNFAIPILEKKLEAEGINVGLNLGKASGAGIPSHLHLHILPRWSGDTNFLPALAHTKVVSFDLKEMYALLKPAFKTSALTFFLLAFL